MYVICRSPITPVRIDVLYVGPAVILFIRLASPTNQHTYISGVEGFSHHTVEGPLSRPTFRAVGRVHGSIHHQVIACGQDHVPRLSYVFQCPRNWRRFYGWNVECKEP